jgi:nucleotidyltransferase substrate binding protein (TIGR01987 family)
MTVKFMRFQQRLQNLNKAFAQLKNGIDLERPSEIETQGIIQIFEFTFELAWKTIKEYLESQSVLARFPREVIKEAVQADILENGDLWLEMLEKRNELAHTYDEKTAKTSYLLIKGSYFQEIQTLIRFFNDLQS